MARTARCAAAVVLLSVCALAAGPERVFQPKSDVDATIIKGEARTDPHGVARAEGHYDQETGRFVIEPFAWIGWRTAPAECKPLRFIISWNYLRLFPQGSAPGQDTIAASFGPFTFGTMLTGTNTSYSIPVDPGNPDGDDTTSDGFPGGFMTGDELCITVEIKTSASRHCPHPPDIGSDTICYEVLR